MKGPVTRPNECLPQSTLMHAPTHSPCLFAAWAREASPCGGSHSFHGPVCLRGLNPHISPSVGEGREDEEAIFFFADPAHQLMDGTDGRCLGPQRAVAHVELKGTCHLEEGAQGSHRG